VGIRRGRHRLLDSCAPCCRRRIGNRHGFCTGTRPGPAAHSRATSTPSSRAARTVRRLTMTLHWASGFSADALTSDLRRKDGGGMGLRKSYQLQRSLSLPLRTVPTRSPRPALAIRARGPPSEEPEAGSSVRILHSRSRGWSQKAPAKGIRAFRPEEPRPRWCAQGPACRHRSRLLADLSR
jgi:hypothetical protein